MGADRRTLLAEMQALSAHTDAYFMDELFAHELGSAKEAPILQMLQSFAANPRETRESLYKFDDPMLVGWEKMQDGDEWKYVNYIDPVKLQESLSFLLSLENRFQDGRVISPKIYEHIERLETHIEEMKKHAEERLSQNDGALRKHGYKEKKPITPETPVHEREAEIVTRMGSLALYTDPEGARQDYCTHRMQIAALETLAQFGRRTAQELDIPRERRI